MRPSSLGMQAVTVDEVEPDGTAPVRLRPAGVLRSSGARAGRWAVRRPTVAALVAAAVAGALAAVAVGTPALVSAVERRQVLRAAAFPGGLLPVGSGLGARWSAPLDADVDPVLVGDVIVGAVGAEPESRALVGLDEVTGERRWTVALGAEPTPRVVRCLAVADRAVCVTDAGPPPERRARPGTTPAPPEQARTWVVDPESGDVLATHRIPGGVVGVGATGDDVVVATYWWGQLGLRRVDPVSGDEVWQRQDGTSASVSAAGGIDLAVAADVALVSIGGASLLVDLAHGERVRRAPSSAGTDETRLLTDGTLVRTHYSLVGGGVRVESELSTGAGDPWLRTEGVPVEPEVSDGASDLVLTSGALTGGPLVGRVNAYRSGRSVPAWQARTAARQVAADVDGRVVLRGAGALVALDARTGDPVWRRAFGLGTGDAFSDGRHLLLERVTPEEGATLVCLDLGTGDTAWSVPLPEGTDGVLRLGAHLYAEGDGRLVALR